MYSRYNEIYPIRNKQKEVVLFVYFVENIVPVHINDDKKRQK